MNELVWLVVIGIASAALIWLAATLGIPAAMKALRAKAGRSTGTLRIVRRNAGQWDLQGKVGPMWLQLSAYRSDWSARVAMQDQVKACIKMVKTRLAKKGKEPARVVVVAHFELYPPGEAPRFETVIRYDELEDKGKPQRSA